MKADRYLQLYPSGAEKPLVSKLQLELEFQRELTKKRQAEQQKPNDPAAVFNQAVVYEKQQEFAKAAERFRRDAELEPEPEQQASIDQRVFALDTS